MSSTALADGNELLKQCTSAIFSIESEVYKKEGDEFNTAFCLGIVRGVKDTLGTLSSVEGVLLPVYRVCFPKKGISVGQAVRIVVKYLNEHPEDLHAYEAILVMKAFYQAYPCK